MPSPQRYKDGWKVNFEYPRSKRHRRQFSNGKHVDPEKAAQQYIDHVLAGKITAKQSIAAAIENYLRWAEFTGKKKHNTIKSDRSRFKRFVSWATHYDLRNITALDISHMRSYQEYFLTNYPFYPKKRRLVITAKRDDADVKRCRLSTWDHQRLTLSAFFNWCVDREMIESNPISRKEFRPVIQQRMHGRPLSNDEARILFEYFDKSETPGVSLFFRFMLYTGFRISEAVRLTWESIDLTHMIITIDKETKNNRIKSVPIHPALLPYLKAVKPRKKSTLLFAKPDGSRLRTAGSWRLIFLTGLKLCGLEHSRLHDLRHTYATQLRRLGMSLEDLQIAMGHSSIKSTERYAHINPEDIRSEINKLDYEKLA